MPKQFQRTQGLKTGINVGTAQVFKDPGIAEFGLKQKKLGLQEKKLDLAGKKRKADSLKAKMALHKEFAIPDDRYLVEGFNKKADDLTNEFIKIKNSTDFDNVGDVAKLRDAFGLYKVELAKMSKVNDIAADKMKQLDNTEMWDEDLFMQAVTEGKVSDPTEMMGILGQMNKVEDLIKPIQVAAGKLNADLTDIEKDTVSERWKSVKESTIKQSAADLHSDLLGRFPREMKSKGWDEYSEFEKAFRPYVKGTEYTVDLDEDKTTSASGYDSTKDIITDSRQMNISSPYKVDDDTKIQYNKASSYVAWTPPKTVSFVLPAGVKGIKPLDVATEEQVGVASSDPEQIEEAGDWNKAIKEIQTELAKPGAGKVELGEVTTMNVYGSGVTGRQNKDLSLEGNIVDDEVYNSNNPEIKKWKDGLIKDGKITKTPVAILKYKDRTFYIPYDKIKDKVSKSFSSKQAQYLKEVEDALYLRNKTNQPTVSESDPLGLGI